MLRGGVENCAAHRAATWRDRAPATPASRCCRPRLRCRWSYWGHADSPCDGNRPRGSILADDRTLTRRAAAAGSDAAPDEPDSRRTDAAAAASGHRMHRCHRTSASVARRCTDPVAHRNLRRWVDGFRWFRWSVDSGRWIQK